MAGNPSPSPMQQLMSIAQGHLAAGALKAALELEVFTLIAHGVDTAAALAEAKKAAPRAMRLLCDALVGLGLVQRQGERLSLSQEMDRLLVKGALSYLGGQIGINNAPWFWEGAHHLAEIVRSGHPLTAQSAEAAEHPFWEEFERNSRQMAAANGKALAELVAEVVDEAAPRRILDIACGSGMYGFALLKRFPDARLVSFDYANVLRLTEKDAQREGLHQRVEFRPGDLFRDPLGQGYDWVLACNIFQIYGPRKVVELSRRLYQALEPAGRLLVHGPIPDDERSHNRPALLFGMNMLIFTQEGEVYTLADYRRMLEEAGFHDIELRETAGTRPVQAVLARK
jgi:trans-aconitate methyltransferase